MAKKSPMVIRLHFLHRPSTPRVHETEVDEERKLTIIRANDGRDSTPEEEVHALCVVGDMLDAVHTRRRERVGNE